VSETRDSIFLVRDHLTRADTLSDPLTNGCLRKINTRFAVEADGLHRGVDDGMLARTGYWRGGRIPRVRGRATRDDNSKIGMHRLIRWEMKK